MKPWMTKFWVRLVAVIVFVVMVLLAILSAAGIWVCVETRVYADGGAELRQDALYSLAARRDHAVSEYYRACENSDDLEWLKEYWEPYFSKERSNYFFEIKDADGNVILKSYSAPYQFHSTGELDPVEYEIQHIDESFDSAAKRQVWLEEFQKDTHRIYSVEQWEDSALEDGMEASPETAQAMTKWYISVEYSDVPNVTLERYIAKDFTARDEISFVMSWVDRLIGMRKALPWVCGISTVLALAVLVFLMILAGRTKDGSSKRTWFDRIPLDLLLVVYVSLGGCSFAILDEFSDWGMLIAAILLIPVWIGLMLALMMSCAARVRTRTFWKNNLIYYIIRWCWRACKWLWHALLALLKNIPLFWKTLLIWAAISLIEFIVIAINDPSARLLFFWLFEKLIATPLILFAVLGMQRLRAGAKAISEGQLDKQVDMKYLYGPFREHAEDLNRITDGLQSAVDERVKSERMKAELITNVSHDIKTPLTSIVNYVDLLGKEELNNERAAEYVAVLSRHAQRLKKLTEDLVEASKASTGNVTVNAAPVDLNVLLSQAAGEFSDRFGERRLEAVLSTSESQPKILADGQLLWRVFSNLMTNIVKYAMPGTRVYLTTEVSGARAIVTFRNISNAALNLTGEELTERFVRGDRSRTGGDGSGLGLSIARSLTELQGGEFTVTVDGDLFKAELSFPLT